MQTLQEEIDFIRRVQDQEIRDLQAMAARDTTSENREFFKNELSSAIRDIRNEYDQVCYSKWQSMFESAFEVFEKRKHFVEDFSSLLISFLFL